MHHVLRGSIFLTLTLLLCSAPCFAEVEFFGTAKVKPTVYSNFDFNDSVDDKPALNEGGWAAGEHIRSELRLGWKASGEKWRIKMIAEADLIYNKDNADRSFYVGATKDNQPNTGSEFGIERAEMGYTFNKYFDLSTGWDIRYLDIKSGGLLYGDDHPFVGFRGALTDSTKYELLYLPIQNREIINQIDALTAQDWRVYTAKVNQTFDTGAGKLTVSPLAAFSDNEDKNAEVFYYGLEILGQLGPVKPSFEIIGADGEFDDIGGVSGNDISSWALFAGLEMPVNRGFNPYVAYRFTQGDDDQNDNEAEGFVGITDIGRFTPLMGMDGNILSEHLASGASIYNSPLYSYAPDRAVGGNNYGGIGNGSSGNNPGQSLIAVGTKGDLSDILPNVTYKAQAFFIWYDETGNLVNVKTPGKKVDDYAGTTFDLQAKYAFNKNFSIDYIFSAFVPGDGIQDQVDADDTAFVNALTLAWTY